jgi:hypothetical protein
MLLRCVSDPASGRWLLWARKVGGAQGGHMLGAASSLGAAGPGMCRLSPWMPLITGPKAVVGRLLGSVLPSTRVDSCDLSSR